MGDDIVLGSIVVLALVAWVSYLVRNEGRRPRRVRVWRKRRVNPKRQANRKRQADNAQVYEYNAQLAQALTATQRDNATLRAQLADVSERLDLARVFVLMWMQRHAEPSDGGWRVVNE